MIIKPTSLTISQLLGSQNEQYVIPAYQRRYSWHEKQLGELLDDIKLLSDTDTHLLGSIVCLATTHTAGVNALEVVDGQQRLTTISILLHCIKERMELAKDVDEARDIERLLQAKAIGSPAVRKIALDSLDSSEFERLTNRVTLDSVENQKLVDAFEFFRKWVVGQSLQDLARFVYRLKSQAVIIRLDVSEAKDAFKLFETINNRGLKLSSADIVKNFILGNAARFGSTALAHAREHWGLLLKHLDGIVLEGFLRHYLSAKYGTSITKAFVVGTFKKHFMLRVAEAESLPDRHVYFDDAEEDEDSDDSVDPAEAEDTEGMEPVDGNERMPFVEFMAHIVKCARTYGEVVRGQTGNATIDRRLRNLRLIKAQPTYGFLMSLLVNGCESGTFGNVLRLTEAVLIRRHTCKMRTSVTDRVFANLCRVNPQDPLPEVRTTFRELSPPDEKFRADFEAFEFEKKMTERARYCLEQIELSALGDHGELQVAGADAVHVEHVMPQKITTNKAKKEFGDWPAYLGAGAESKHPEYVSRIGNLTLLAGALNIAASNNPYARKHPSYLKSAIKMTSELPTTYPEFGFEQIDHRSARLAELAVKLWPIP